MPLARRLSNSSQEAFTEFCSKNQPLSRRLSSNGDTASVISANRRESIAKERGKRVLKRRNKSRNLAKARTMNSTVQKNQINISTPEAKKQRLSRRKSRTNKENVGVDNNVGGPMMSPTPYWKVAQERGGEFSPRATRSSKKNKWQSSRGKVLNFDSGAATKPKDGVILFSPPNQAENVCREKKEQEKKMQERSDRINKNRRNGQLLVFSNNLESLTHLPLDDSGNNGHEEDSTKTVKQQSRKELDEHEENASSSISMNDVGQVRDIEELSCLSKSTNYGEPSQEMMNVIKGLDEKFEILDRRLSEFHPSQSVAEQSSYKNTAEKLRIKTIEIKELSQTKSRLEKQNKNLTLELSSLKIDVSAERQKIVSIGAELEQMKSLNESFKIDLSAYKETNENLRNKVLPRTEKELQNSLEELKKREEIINQTSSRLLEYETKMKKLKSENERILEEAQNEKSHFQTLNEDSHRAQQHQQLENKKKDKNFKEIQQSLSSTKSELDDERFRNNEKIMELQNTLLQLKSSMIEKEKIEKQFSDFKYEIVTKNKENNAAVRLVQEERERLQNHLKDVENKLKSVTEEKNDALLRLGTSDRREDELFNMLRESDRVRKELHARVMVLIGNIRVFVRVRPPLPIELESSNGQNADQIFNFSSGSGSLNGKKSSKYGCDDPTKNILEVKEPCKDRGGLSQRRKKWSFGFDNVFDPSNSQEDLWEATEPLVQCAIDGFNVTLFAYGQTGSGKTFTMLGDSESSADQGLIFRSIRKLFDAKARIEGISKGDKSITMTVELLEIYNEQVRDLLSPKAVGLSNQETSLKISGNKAVGSIQQPVDDEADVFEILRRAEKRRTVKATSSNATSSRSHLLFTIEYTITSKNGTSQVGKLNVCDLAGSERLAKSGAHIAGGSLLKETKHINMSLSSLSNVIERLQAGDKNVPFRDSKLTSLLQNSLGGNSKTLCVICCNPLQAHFHETLCSLRFAAKINKCDLKSVQNFSA